MESNGVVSPQNEISQPNESFLAFRQRQYRSVSTESVKSERSDAGSESIEDHPDIFQSSPVRKPEVNDVIMKVDDDDFVEDHEVLDKCCAAFGNSMEMRISIPQQRVVDMRDVVSENGITSFDETADGFHGHAKFRRASPPRRRQTKQTSKKNRDKMKKQHPTPLASLGASTSSQPPTEPNSNFADHSFRKRSWARIVDHTNN